MKSTLHYMRVITASVILLATAPAFAQSVAALNSIPILDVSRYLGRWYEIAKLPNWFQKKCVSDTSADYSLMPNGVLRVQNQCRLQNGERDQAIGVARQIGGVSSAKLEVRFAPDWLSALPFVWGNYWVVDLDEAYSLAAVSEPKREYLWILSRTPAVDASRYAALLVRLAAMGLDIHKLESTVQHAP